MFLSILTSGIKLRIRYISLLVLVILLAMSLTHEVGALARDQQAEGDLIVIGQLIDPQGEPIVEASIQALLPGDSEPSIEVDSDEDGYWFMPLLSVPYENFESKIEHPHFVPQTFIISPAERAQLSELGFISLDELELQRRVTLGFWAATIIFLGV